jgi:tripartite-type tricarboxylate transporter receptor subunit TctC
MIKKLSSMRNLRTPAASRLHSWRQFLRCGLILFALGIFAGAASAQSYPSRQISLIVPYAPGGVLDLVARLLAEGLREKYGQPVVVLNRAGGNGNIGTAEAVRAEPNGYTLYLNNDGGLAIHAAVDPQFKFDAVADFVPIAMPAEYSHLFIVHKDVPANSVQEFVTYAMANPGKLSYGSPATGSLGHLATEMFDQHAGIKMTHVPYRGAAPALNDLVAGTLTMNIQSIPSARGQYESDRLKILAVFNDKRVPELPKVPTMAEAGFPGFVIKSWLGVFGPRRLPDPIRDQLSTVMSEIVKSPGAEAQLRRVGFEPVGMTAADFRQFYVDELQRWQKIANQTGIKDVH